MFAYGIGILPLIPQLKADIPQVEQPWYADDAGAGARFDEIERFFCRLCEAASRSSAFAMRLNAKAAVS
jgi:hypothetical protein